MSIDSFGDNRLASGWLALLYVYSVSVFTIV